MAKYPPILPLTVLLNGRPTQIFVPMEIHDRCAPEFGTAKLAYNFPAAAADGLGGANVWNWRGHFSTDDSITIQLAGSAGANGQAGAPTVLFDGYITESDWSYDRTQNATITAVSAEFRLWRDQQFVVYGQVRASMAGAPLWCTAMKSSFNEGGLPNRAGAMASYNQAQCYFFADRYAAGTTFWRLLDAVDYLISAHNPTDAFCGRPAFAAADYAAAPVVQCDVTGLSLWAALARLCNSVGYDVVAQCSTDSTGAPAHRILVVKRGMGPAVTVNKQASGKLDPTQTNAFAASVAENTISCITAPIVAGGTGIIEITAPLYPCWDPADNPPSTMIPVECGKEQISSGDPYVQMYCTMGSLFARHALTGRLWDANTDGYYSAQPITDVAALCGQAAGSWPQMQYPACPLLTRLTDTAIGSGCQAFAQWSIDGGISWWPFKGSHTILQGRLGLYINQENLFGITPNNPLGDKYDDNFMSVLQADPAMLKMRITCSVQAPLRNVLAASARATAGTKFLQGAWFDREQLGQIRYRSPASVFAQPEFMGMGIGAFLPADTADGASPPRNRFGQSVVAQGGFTTLPAVAAYIQDANEDRFVEGSITMETLRPDIALLSSVRQIAGINVPLGVNSGASVRYPRVVQRILRLTKETWQTELILDTDRQAAVK